MGPPLLFLSGRYVRCTAVSAREYPRSHGVQVTVDSVYLCHCTVLSNIYTRYAEVAFTCSLETFFFPFPLRPTVNLGVRRPSGIRDQFHFRLEIFFRQLRFCNFVAPSLTRRRVCNLLYNCFWALPEQSLLGQSSAELTAIFYCLI
jgi:hypothetical protein